MASESWVTGTTRSSCCDAAGNGDCNPTPETLITSSICNGLLADVLLSASLGISVLVNCLFSATFLTSLALTDEVLVSAATSKMGNDNANFCEALDIIKSSSHDEKITEILSIK